MMRPKQICLTVCAFALAILAMQPAVALGEAHSNTAAASTTRQIEPTWRDLAYAPQPVGGRPSRHILDVYAVPNAQRAPLVVFVHGGGWWRGDKAGGQRSHPAAMLAHGYAYASINYRLAGDAPPDAAAQDVALAVAYLRSESDRFDVDPDRIVLMGHSAGAHLAALAALDPRYLQSANVPQESIRAVILLDGAGYDIPRQISDGANAELYSQVFGDDPEYIRRMSPITYTDRVDPPAFLLHHVAGRGPSAAQADALASALRSAGGVAEVFAAEGETHASINRGFGEPGDAVTEKTFQFLEQVFGGEQSGVETNGQ